MKNAIVPRRHAAPRTALEHSVAGAASAECGSRVHIECASECGRRPRAGIVLAVVGPIEYSGCVPTTPLDVGAS